MRRPVFAEADRGPHVVGEDQEGAAERNEAAMQCDPVQRGSHCMLANSEVKVSARPATLYFGIVRARQIGGSAQQLWKLRRESIEYFAGRGTRRLCVLGTEDRQRRIPARGQAGGKPPLQLRGKLSMRCAIPVPLLLPVCFELGAAGFGRAPLLERVVRNVERLERRPAEVLLRRFNLVGAERGAVGLGSVLLVGA